MKKYKWKNQLIRDSCFVLPNNEKQIKYRSQRHHTKKKKNIKIHTKRSNLFRFVLLWWVCMCACDVYVEYINWIIIFYNIDLIYNALHVPCHMQSTEQNIHENEVDLNEKKKTTNKHYTSELTVVIDVSQSNWNHFIALLRWCSTIHRM